MSVIQNAPHVFFWHGIYSQWHMSAFEESLWRGGPLMKFNCAEQYMMAAKAMLFGDVTGEIMPDGTYQPSALEKIMAAATPREQKALGRTVRGFDEEIWNRHARQIVFRASHAKFSQCHALRADLIATGERLLVEGSPYDRIWGVGLQYDDPAIQNPDNWRGMNWLGEVLTVTRDILKSDIKIDVWSENPFAQ